ncbi:MAG TPA: helix-turn-helix transcriptional regulator [Trichocoleus sp.]|jgi:DNA-binding transcriptional regulator YiaG
MLRAEQPAIGKTILELRQQMGLTQGDFAAKIGVSWLTVNRWENGRNKPSAIALRQIEKLLKKKGNRNPQE